MSALTAAFWRIPTYVQKSLPLLTAEVSVCITQNETNGGEEVTFAGTIPADDDIVLGGERLNDCLILVARFRHISFTHIVEIQ